MVTVKNPQDGFVWQHHRKPSQPIATRLALSDGSRHILNDLANLTGDERKIWE
jgi:hypothetical protein